MIDVLQPEKLIGLREAARLANAGHVSTVLRWIMRGIRAHNGERVKLEATRLGGRWQTTAEALERFRAKLTPAGVEPLCPIRSAGTRERQVRRAEQELAKIGI